MPWQAEVQAPPQSTAREEAGQQAAEAMTRSIAMCHATTQQLQHPPGVKE